MSYRSHTRTECAAAQQQGKLLWNIDTGGDGDDDVVIYPPTTTREQVIQDLLYHHDMESLPDTWAVTRVDYPIDA